MIFLTLNCIGLANSSNKLALKRLIEVHSPFTIFLQVIITDGGEAIKDLSNILGG
jgi:hypothetical protein